MTLPKQAARFCEMVQKRQMVALAFAMFLTIAVAAVAAADAGSSSQIRTLYDSLSTERQG